MALQLWYPFSKDLTNHGLTGGGTLTNISLNSSGKIGNCGKTTTTYADTGYVANINTSSYSFGGWFKFNKDEINAIVSSLSYSSSATSATGDLIGNNGYGGYALTWTTNNYYSSGSFTNLYVFGSIRSSNDGTYQSTNTINVEFDTWIHFTVTFDNVKKIMCLYKNGMLFDSKSVGALTTAPIRNVYLNIYYIYSGNGPGACIPYYMNDIRIYDHCLSPKEVKDISKGLLLHYKLNLPKSTGIGNTNLVANGYGGSDNWAYTGSSQIMTDVPSGTNITNSYGNDNYTKQYIPIIGNHNYTISEYVKKQSQSTCYVSLIPYDIDYNRINHHTERDGFRASSLTTLSQDLKNGDTVVHLTNASGWANPSTYEVEVAIFGYKDSTGHVYPDLEYTRTILRYGSTTDKSNLDIANNRVTLLSAYSGDTIPAGTSVCLSGWGGTYYYPITCPASQAEDWKQISTTITPQSINYLKPAKYLRVTTMSSYNYVSGVMLKDNTADSTIYDMSEFGNNGTLYGDFTIDSTTPRYDCSLNFDGGATSIKIGNLAEMIHDGIYTFNVWFKVYSFGSKGWGTIFGGPGGFEIQSKRSGTASPVIVAYSWGQSSEGGQSYELNKWNMLTMVRTTSNCKFYLNGSLYYTGSAGSIPSGDYFLGAWRSYSEQNYKGSMSDARIYCTALSDNDILELYNSSAYVDDMGDVACYEFNEKNVNTEVTQTGYIDTQNIMELHPYIYLSAESYINTNLYYNDSDVCKAITVMRYAENGSGRDLMGYSGAGAGYWGVTTSSAWEPHGTFSYTNSDITKLNIITYQFSSSSEHGYYHIGALSGGYSTRNKYIYNVKLYKNGVLHRNLFPYMNGTTPGMLDIYNNVFYPVTGSNAVVANDEEDHVAKIFDTHIKGFEFIEF